MEKKIWATFEDGLTHHSVHLNDFKPELIKDVAEKELKANSLKLYQEFHPELFSEQLISFLAYNLSDNKKKKLEIYNTKRPLLTALLITYNEEHNIREVIENIAFADEIIIIDSFSSDKTVAIAESFKQVKIIQNQFTNYALQRNFAIQHATNPWILFIDADERLSTKLQQEILCTIKQEDALSAYYMNRTFMFKNTQLRFSGWQTDKIIRLFQNGKALYSEQKIVHEKLQLTGKTGKLKNKLTHYSYNDYSNYKQKMIFYGKLKAKEASLTGTNPNFFHYYIRPVYRFIYQYFIRLGILDGKKGLIICYLNSLSVYVRFQELKKLKSQN